MKSGHKRRRHKLPKEHFLYCGDRVVNFRPCLVILLFCATGIILMLVAFNIAPLGIALLSGLFILLITLTIVCSVLGKLNMALTFAVAVCVTAAAVYLFYAAVPSVLGSLIGAFLGNQALPRICWSARARAASTSGMISWNSFSSPSS